MPFTTVFSLASLALIGYLLLKIGPLLIQQNKLIDNNSRAVACNTEAVKGLVVAVNTFQTLASDMKVHTNKVETGINTLHSDMRDVKQNLHALGGRLDMAMVHKDRC